MSTASPADLPRALTTLERGALEFALATLDDQTASVLRAQAAVAVVDGYCSCGCATIDIAVPTSTPKLRKDGQLLGDVSVLDADGNGVGGLLLFVADGWITMFEIWSYDDPITAFPAIERLRGRH